MTDLKYFGDEESSENAIFNIEGNQKNFAEHIVKFLNQNNSVWKKKILKDGFDDRAVSYINENDEYQIELNFGYLAHKHSEKIDIENDKKYLYQSITLKPIKKYFKSFIFSFDFRIKEKNYKYKKVGFLIKRNVKIEEELIKKNLLITPLSYPFFGSEDTETYNKFLKANDFSIEEKVIRSLFRLNQLINDYMKFSNDYFLKKEKIKLKAIADKKDRIAKKRLKHKKTIANTLSEFDKDGNGKLDTIELKDEFQKLLTKHQSIIIEEDKAFIQQLIKISNYHKQKRENLQKIFTSMKKSKNIVELNKAKKLLKEQIHSYELLLFHSINMVVSLTKKDFVTYYEIHTAFDDLNIFNTNHQNEISEKLTDLVTKLKDIEGGLYNLILSVNSMDRNIISTLNRLSYVNQKSFEDLTNSVNRELNSIGSAINTNNLLTAINIYQNYSTNRRLKS
jgi:hypothetical protein